MMHEASAQAPSRRTIWGVIVLFLVAGLLVYGRSLGNDFVRWDDGMLIYENPAVREISPWSVGRAFTSYDPELYIPLTFVSYQFDYLVWGTNAFGYHLTSLLLHVGNAILVAWLLASLLRWRTLGVLGGALFLLHPLHTEAVAWASGRKDVLSTFFLLFAILLYRLWRDREERKFLLWSLVVFACGLMSKVMVITLPAILILIDLWERRPLDRRMFTEKIPYALLSLLFCVIAIIGKTGVAASSSALDKILMALKSTAFYLRQFFVPLDFSLLYPHTGPISLASPDFALSGGVVLLLLLIAIALWKRVRGVSIGIVFYLLTLAPTFINFAKGGELDLYFASDRYAYVPSIGLILALCAPLDVLRLAALASIVRRVLGVVTAVVLGFVGWQAYAQSQVWRDTESLFANVLRLYPESSYVAHNNLGNMYRLRGEVDRSIEEYRQAIAIRPHAKTYANLGAAYRRKGQRAEARQAFQDALKIDARNPDAHTGLGLLAVDEGRVADAEKEYRTAIDADARAVAARTNLGVLLIGQGRLEEAVEQLRIATHLNPALAEAAYNLGIAYTKLSEVDAAMAAFRAAVRAAPSFAAARLNYASVLLHVGRNAEARSELETVLRMDPQNAAARQLLQRMQ